MVIYLSLPSFSAVSETERNALIKFYQATDGDNWALKKGSFLWKKPPLHADGFSKVGSESKWYGVTVKNDCVTELVFTQGVLNGPIPAEIGNLSSLTNLHLQHNGLINQIPAEIGNLVNLSQLYLNSAQIESIPPEIGNLIHLSNLHLINCQIKSIPPEIGNLVNLKELTISGNMLSTFPTEIGNLEKLENLNASFNQLICLPWEISQLTPLTTLNVANNLLTSLPKSIMNLAITTLSIEFNSIFPKDVELSAWLDSKSVAWRDFQTKIGDDVLGSYSGAGVWERNSELGNWINYRISDLNRLTTADIDGNGLKDSFIWLKNTNEIFIRYDNSDFEKQAINNETLLDFSSGDLNKDGKADFLGAWQISGIWWRDAQSLKWTQLSKLIPIQLATGYFDEDAMIDFISVFDTGVWIYYSKTGLWERQLINHSDLISIATGDINGDKKTDIIGFWTFGLWWRDADTLIWTKLSNYVTDVLAIGDFDHDTKDDFVGSWESIGTWVRYSGSGVWEKISKYSADCLAAGIFW
jgi:Leucine-rich repeat (LRR) protein